MSADEPRYVYDMTAVQTAAEEVATALEHSGEDQAKVPVMINKKGQLTVDSAVFENLSASARQSRIKELTDALMSMIQRIIDRANRQQSEQSDAE